MQGQTEKVKGTQKGNTQSARTGVQMRLVAWDDSDHPELHVVDRDAYVAFSTAKQIAEWFGADQGAGRFKYQLFAGSSGLFLKEEWIADQGYSWDEERLYKLLMPDEEEGE